MKQVILTPVNGQPLTMTADEFAQYHYWMLEGTSHAKNFRADTIKNGSASPESIKDIFGVDADETTDTIRGMIEYRLCRGYKHNNRALYRFLNWMSKSGGYTVEVSE